MAQELCAYTFTSPDGTVAVLQDPASSSFCGYITDDAGGITGLDSPEIRENADFNAGLHGGIHGSFLFGRRPFTYAGVIPPSAALGGTLNQRVDRLDHCIKNCLEADGLVQWTETGAVKKRLSFRAQLPPKISGHNARAFFLGLVSADYRILSDALHTFGPATSFSGGTAIVNAGVVGSSPVFSIVTPANDISIVNTSLPSGLNTVRLLGLSGGGAVTVDFAARTVMQGGVSKRGSIKFPDSVWWTLLPGSNALTITSSASISFRDAWD